MSIDKVLERYRDVVRSDIFAKHEKDFSDRIISGLSKGYLRGLHEPPLVSTVEDVVNSVGNFGEKSHQPYFELSTRSIFIHGNKSHVRFKYYGDWTDPIELGDLIFIISIVYHGMKHFERMTINQFKKDKDKSKNTFWDIANKKQLYLLSRFPAFIGDKGLIPKTTYYLPNYSGCLGSYGLLYEPGDFAFVSATGLDCFIGNRRTLKMTELYNLVNVRIRHPFRWWGAFLPWVLPIFDLDNCHFANDVTSFVHEYLRANIGEPVFMKIGMDNRQVGHFLDELMSAIKSKGKKEKSYEMLDFVDEFRRFPCFNRDRSNESDRDREPEGGGIGIIHTTINLGE